MIVSLDDIQPLRQEHRSKRIGYAVGSFDLFHGGHLDYLEWAWNHCDLLFVAVRSDERIKSVKNLTRPIIAQTDRVRIVDSLKGVSFTHIIEDFQYAPKPSIKIAEILQPDVVILGNDWGHEAPAWSQALQNDTEVVICPIPYRESTSRIVNRILSGR